MLKKIQNELNEMVQYAIIPKAISFSMHHLNKLYPTEDTKALYKRIYFRGNVSLAFQKREIAEAKIFENDNGYNIELTLNFLALFGSSSPLPSHYSEMVLQDADNNQNLKDFLDIFNHHLQKFIYEIWSRNRYYVKYQEDFMDDFSKYILSLIGLYNFKNDAYKTLKINKLLPFLGLLLINNKSSSMLIPMIKHYCEHKDIEIIECVERDVQIPSWQHSLMGNRNCLLGKTTLLGGVMRSKNTMFRIVFKNVPWDNLKDYSSQGAKMKELSELIDFLLDEPLAYDVALDVDPNNICQMRLGDEQTSYLGVNMVIGKSIEPLYVSFKNETKNISQRISQ